MHMKLPTFKTVGLEKHISWSEMNIRAGPGRSEGFGLSRAMSETPRESIMLPESLSTQPRCPMVTRLQCHPLGPSNRGGSKSKGRARC